MAVSYNIVIDPKRCVHCDTCVAFCPVEVFDSGPLIARPELCWGCETCVGQCPESAITVRAQSSDDKAGGVGKAGETGGAGEPDILPLPEKAQSLPAERQQIFADWVKVLKSTLGLRWEPVAIRLYAAGEPLPDLPLPAERLRYCQSLMAARRGRGYLMPANRHACPDGTAILGLTELAPKLASGELYQLFHKLDSDEAARQMVAERPHLPPRSIEATAVMPLVNTIFEPQVIAVFAQPEQVMWLCMSASYYTGHRFDFHASGYNAQCVETTLIPYLSGEPNISFGCYGCRASSDISDDLMFMGIPTALMPTLVIGLQELGSKAIPQSRAKIYLPPM
jgi:uncharacterized protein (DUF169 family)/NAD-dependent dihydropyrimidine dehydrogenase PreA subunit